MKVKLLKTIRNEILINYDEIDKCYTVTDYTTPVSVVGYDRWCFDSMFDAIKKLREVRLIRARRMMYENSSLFVYVRDRFKTLQY